MTRTTVQTCVRALSRLFRVAQFAVTAVTDRCVVLITCLAIVEKDLHDLAIGAKLARGRVHPVAVVTASSRISRSSATRAGWPTVLSTNGRRDWHAAVLLGRSSGWMNIGQPSHGRRPLVEHGWPSGARVLRYPTAGSHHSSGVDSITRRFRADVPTSLKMGHAPSTPGSLVLLGSARRHSCCLLYTSPSPRD